MTDELRHHWILHEIDEEAVRHEGERAKLPAQRQAFEARVAGERRKLAEIDARAAALDKRRRELERDIATFEAQEKKYRVQLDAVTDQKQFEAVQHEIAGVAGKRSDLETQALTVMDDEERNTGARPHAAEVLARAERESGEGLARIAAEQARLDGLIAALDARRIETTALLEPSARTRYERARLLRGGRGVAAIDKGACGGCYRNLAPHALQEARKRDHLIVCDGCGRLVMLPPEDGAGT